MTVLVYARKIWAQNLIPGSIVVSGGQAVYLVSKIGLTSGYHRWTTTRYDDDGTAHPGTYEYRDGSHVTVVAQLDDGTILAPSD